MNVAVEQVRDTPLAGSAHQQIVRIRQRISADLVQRLCADDPMAGCQQRAICINARSSIEGLRRREARRCHEGRGGGAYLLGATALRFGQSERVTDHTGASRWPVHVAAGQKPCRPAADALPAWPMREPAVLAARSVWIYQRWATSITTRDPLPGPGRANTRNGNRARTPTPIVVYPSNVPRNAT